MDTWTLFSQGTIIFGMHFLFLHVFKIHFAETYS